ncbi:MAG: hypothetical protein ACYTEV_04060 [Planctomycetota bacterium]
MSSRETLAGLATLVTRMADEPDRFVAESRLAQGLRSAVTAGALDLVPGIVSALADCRMASREAALDAGRLTIVTEPFEDEVQLEPGLYLLHPPLVVGADARRIRLLALEQKVPVVAVCREPVTAIGLCPVVAISPGCTIRTKLRPPATWDDAEAVADWMMEAHDALGDAAVDQLDAELAASRRLDQLLDRLDAIPEHRELHEAIAAIVPEAIAEAREDAESGGRRRRTRQAS